MRVDGSSRRTSESNGDGIEDSPSDDDVVVIEEEEGEVKDVEEEDYYDKSKSFFDNITCEGNTRGRYTKDNWIITWGITHSRSISCPRLLNCIIGSLLIMRKGR